jgi:hypothetical protein
MGQVFELLKQHPKQQLRKQPPGRSPKNIAVKKEIKNHYKSMQKPMKKLKGLQNKSPFNCGRGDRI